MRQCVAEPVRCGEKSERRLPPMVRAGIAVVAVQPQRRLCRQQKNLRFFCPRRTCMAIRTSEGSPRCSTWCRVKSVVATAERVSHAQGTSEHCT
ncbi:hypothetical protein ACF3DV_06355 [Chlorogloeopsis fritschii PCC 9212]|uniref:hypothetical protein n=1 Tax=Chlorogloeopsis fritschii TaxID=1124 RepID=UPI000F8D5E3C|nr:hypothetical protein [Chlorogloeopsis fritschii]